MLLELFVSPGRITRVGGGGGTADGLPVIDWDDFEIDRFEFESDETGFGPLLWLLSFELFIMEAWE